MNRKNMFFASILFLILCMTGSAYAQTKIDWKQIKNIPKKLHFEDVYVNHLIFEPAYQPVMDSIYQGAIYYDNRYNRLRVYEFGQWHDLLTTVTIASDSIGAPLTILGYLQATDLFASNSAFINNELHVGGNIYGSGTSYLDSLQVNNTLRIPLTASTTLGVGSIYYDSVNNTVKVLDGNNQWQDLGGGSSITVDTEMSDISTNAVENRVIKAYVDSRVGYMSRFPTTQPSNPVTGDVYYDAVNDVLRIYNGSTWKIFYPYGSSPTPAPAPGVASYNIRLAAYLTEDGGTTSSQYSFVSGEIQTPDLGRCLYPDLLSSDDGVTYSSVSGYQPGSIFCPGYEVINEGADYKDLKVMFILPVSSVALSYGATGSNIRHYYYYELERITGVFNGIAQSLGYQGFGAPYAFIPTEFGVFTGVGSDVLLFRNKRYKFDFRTDNLEHTPNCVRIDSGFDRDTSKNEFFESIDYPSFTTGSIITLKNWQFSVQNTYETTVNGTQQYYYGSAIWFKLPVRVR